MPSEVKKTVVLFMIDYLGISPNWQGNVVLSANSDSFSKIWQEYPHYLLNTFLSPVLSNEYINPEIYHAAISCGSKVSSDSKFVEEELAKNLWQNQNLNKIVSQVLNRNSALHLFFNISLEESKYGNTDNLIKIVKYFRQCKIFNINIHLIIDETLPNDSVGLNKVKKLEGQLLKIDAADIVSIVGQGYLKASNRNMIEYIRHLVGGIGSKIYSIEQFFKKQSSFLSPGAKPAKIIVPRDKKEMPMSEFDVVISCNNSNDPVIHQLLSILAQSNLSFSRIKIPRYISVYIFIDSGQNKNDDIKIIFKRSFANNLTNVLNRSDIRQLHIADGNRIKYFKNYFDGGLPEKIDEIFLNDPNTDSKVLDKIFEYTINAINKNSHQFIVSELSVLENVSDGKANFKEGLMQFNKLANWLYRIASSVKDDNTVIIITSNYGGVEKISGRSQWEVLNKMSLNPIPFILVSNFLKTERKQNLNMYNQVMYDIIKKKHHITDIAPTILELFSLQIPQSMEGKSLINLRR